MRNISEKIHHEKLAGIELAVSRTGAKEIVTVIGSFIGGIRLSPKHAPETAALTTLMLSEGTREHTKEEVAHFLESLGASIEFSNDAFYTRFTVKCLRKDISRVIELLSLELREPRFGASEFEVVKKRYIGDLREANAETYERARNTFAATIYPANHPNYIPPFTERIRAVEHAKLEDIRTFHEAVFGLGSMRIVFVGDIDMEEARTATVNAFNGWGIKKVHLPKEPIIEKGGVGKTLRVTMHDKASVDISYGNFLGLRERDADYYPLALGISALGNPGTFRARLMSEVREKRGLTYAIYAYVKGMSAGMQGYWFIWGTFAPALLDKGLTATEKILANWISRGITEKELAVRKESLAGSYEVGLSTTGGLASTILATLERDYPLSRIDEFPNLVKKITRTEVNRAIKKYIHPKKLTLVTAGSIDASGKPLG